MTKYEVVTPVTAWMKGGVVEAENADEAMELAYSDMTPYPELCECCAKKFRLEEPDGSGVGIRKIE